MTLASEFLFRMKLDVGAMIDAPGLPSGMRRVVAIDGGSLLGPAIRGSLVPPGAVWAWVRPDGVLLNEARFVMRTATGADLHVHYEGILEPRNTATDAPVYLRSMLRFETQDRDLAWLNARMAVGVGELASRGVEYDVYLLT